MGRIGEMHGFIILQDLGLPTNTRIYGGSEIVCHVERVTIAGKNNVSIPFRPNQEKGFVTADNSNIGNNWNRRKSNIQNSGHDNLNITIAGGWNTDQVGSVHSTFTSPFNGSVMALTPFMLFRLATSGRTFWLKGGTAIQQIIDGQNDLTTIANGSFFASVGSGVPVTIVDWVIEDAASDIEYVSWSMNLAEDKDNTHYTN